MYESGGAHGSTKGLEAKMTQLLKTRVLIVDDDVAMGKLLQIVFQHAGFQVTQMRSGEEALAEATTNVPDLVLLDVMLPGMDGYTLCRRLREHPATKTLPILMLSAQSDTRDMLAWSKAGADDYTAKPFEPDDLVARANALLARSQAKSSTK